MFKRIGNWIGNTARGVTDVTKKTIGTEEIQRNKEEIVEMAKKVATPSKKRREETFANAYLRQGMNEMLLQKNYKNFLLRFYILYGFAMVSAGAMIYFLLQGTWMGVFANIGVLSFFTAHTMVTAFRLHQIQQRELIGFGEWIRDPKRWIPGGWDSVKPPEVMQIYSIPKPPKSQKMLKKHV